MLKMLGSTLLRRSTAKASLMMENNDKKGNQKFLVMKSFRRIFCTRVEDTLKIRHSTDVELTYHKLPLQYSL